MPTIGENIRRFRQQRGLTQRELAEMMEGRAGPFVSMHERNHIQPSLFTLELFARALEVNPHDLMEELAEPSIKAANSE